MGELMEAVASCEMAILGFVSMVDYARTDISAESDGVPLDNPIWLDARNYLLSLPQAPNILAFGIGEADPEIIKQVATKPQFAFQASSGMDTGAAISEFINTLTQSVVSSGQALADGQAQLNFEKPEGFISLDVEAI